MSSYGPDRRAEVISHLGSLVLCCCGEGGALHRRRCVWGALAVSWPGSQRLGALSTGTPRPLPPRPQRAPQVRSQEVFRQDPGPVCRVGGGGFSGAEFSPFPSPRLLPPVGMGRLFSGVSQSLCFANRRRCVPAGQFFSRSPTVLKNLPPTALRAFWPVPTLRNAAGSSPFRPLLSVRPLLLVAGAGVWGYFSAGSCF